ncbi:hypothetical protein B0H14DRAFT_2608194 [Mycena olivaceomarginata]|nr:hypothetical protein B0H14DRAFT_2608194 [Mycena olivaceomarginata]
MWHPYQHPVFFALDSICNCIVRSSLFTFGVNCNCALDAPAPRLNRIRRSAQIGANTPYSAFESPMLLPAQQYRVRFLSYQLPGSPPPFFRCTRSFSAYASAHILQLGRVFKVLILAFTIYETNFHWFNLVSHCRELNTNDAPHFTGTALATHRAIHKLSIQFHGFLTSHIATLQIHISHSRGAAGPASKSRSQDELLSFSKNIDFKLTALTSLAQSKTYLSLTLFNNLHIGSG